MNWSERQLEAIEKRDSNVLVAAAAGSGKTAVLVERIRRLVIEDRVPVDRMLIVTFTNAAASEMKEKIRQALYAEQDGDRTKAAYARRQLALLPQANISTFHSFALSVMRKYFYLTDLEPGFSICDEARGTILREDAMDELLEKRFEEGNPEFHSFLDRYSSGRNMDGVRDMILSVYDGLMAMPYPWKWLEEKTGELSMTGEEIGKSRLMEYIWKYAREILTNLGIWEALQGKISFGTNVTEVLNWVAEGSADCGIVYATDAAATDRVTVVSEAPEGSLDTPVVYPAALLKQTEVKNTDAAELFFEYILSDEAYSVFAEYGFADHRSE